MLGWSIHSSIHLDIGAARWLKTKKATLISNRRLRTFLFLTAIFLILFTTSASTQPPWPKMECILIGDSEENKLNEYWTEYQMKKASPMPLPEWNKETSKLLQGYQQESLEDPPGKEDSKVIATPGVPTLCGYKFTPSFIRWKAFCNRHYTRRYIHKRYIRILYRLFHRQIRYSLDSSALCSKSSRLVQKLLLRTCL